MFTFSNNENLCKVFSQEGKYDHFRTVAQNLLHDNPIYEFDAEGNKTQVTKTQANKAVQKVFMEVLHLSQDDLKSRRRRHYAEKKYGLDLYEIISEDVENAVEHGFAESEWFQALVDRRNVALGDAIQFNVEDSSNLLFISEVSGDNHDVTMQQLPAGKHFTIETTAHAVKIGKDIDLVVLGRYDYPRMIQAISDSYVQDVQKLAYDAIGEAVKQLPSGNDFVNTGALTSATKGDFDQIIENVSIANNSDVIIVGTKTALKKLTGFYNNAVEWVSNEQKNQIASTGRLGSYEGTELIEIPQRFKIGSYEKLFDNDKLYILPRTMDAPIKMVDDGEVEIYESNEKGALQDDFQTYEVSRRYGVGVALGRLFGQWTIEAA